MTGPKLIAIGQRLGLSRIEWARALGYSGSDESVRVCLSRMGSSERVTLPVERLATMYERYGIPEEFLR
jgi:hypothetical protein